MTFKPPAYPKELTDKWWQSNKGIVAKIATKDKGTGVGKALTDLQAAFAKLDFTHVDFEQKAPGSLGSRTPDDIKVGMGRAKDACKAADAVSKRAKTVEKAAIDLAAVWRKEKLIPKASVDTTVKIAKAAGALADALEAETLWKSVKDGVFAEQEARKKNEAILRKVLADLPAKLDKLIVDMPRVTAENWVDFYRQNIRFIGTQSRKIKTAYPKSAGAVDAWMVAADHPRVPASNMELQQWTTDMVQAATALRAALV